jgi:DNA-binding transcriptional MerR regulator
MLQGVDFLERGWAMHIGKVAKKTGLTRDAIRFYERNALLPRPLRTAGGFRQYADADVETLAFIPQVQGLGFTLKEVHELLELRRSRLQPCAPVRRRLEQKLSQLRAKLKNLQNLEHELRAALRACNRKLRNKSMRCPLLSGSGGQKPARAE